MPKRLILFVFTLFLLAATNIWIRTTTVKETYAYVGNEKELRKLEQDIQSLRLQWLKLTSPGKLESFARSLNLLPPTMEQTLKVKGTL